MMQKFQYNLIDMLCLQWTAITSDNNDKQTYTTSIHLTNCKIIECDVRLLELSSQETQCLAFCVKVLALEKKKKGKKVLI